MKFASKLALTLALVLWVMYPGVAQAQDTGRISVSFMPAMASMDGDSEFALAGTAGYRFAKHLSFETDITWINAAAGGFRNRVVDFGDGRVNATNTVNTILRFTNTMFGGRNRLPNFDTPLGTIVPGLTNIGDLTASTGGNTWIGTMGLRYEPTTQTDRFRPYLSGGFGINYTSQTISLNAASMQRMFDESANDSGLALSAGGGADIRLVRAFWVSADAKYFRLSRSRDVVRVGGGLTFKF
jgi:hypothetical protein